MQKENDNIPKKARITIGIISFVIAIAVTSPAWLKLINQIQDDIRIKKQAELIQDGIDAGNKAEEMASQLNDIEVNVSSEVDDASNAADKIKDLLDDLKQND